MSLVQQIFLRKFSTTTSLNELRLLSRVKVVDNSKIGRNAKQSGRPVRIIHVYNKTHVGRLGDRVLVTIEHEKKKGYIVGCKQNQQPLIPKFDSNNIVLVDDNGQPLGTRIRTPIPSCLRSNTDPNFVKLLSLATTFV
ncbi:large ribosomal subunit protein uL14m-like [Saccostrea cucullata]|uniref:large ribosomal subunit protein uL14m-like n=1 Tax=Saccostrea cuccullata TaxID=36930 RepID=UPI002ED43252